MSSDDKLAASEQASSNCKRQRQVCVQKAVNEDDEPYER